MGDKSTGKTLLAIEACANLLMQYPQAKIWYREAEAAFDMAYARSLGLQTDRVDFGPDGANSFWDTVEDIHEDLEKQLSKNTEPGLYIIDSLDALTTRAALERKIGEGYQTEKARVMSECLSKMVRSIRRSQVALIVISQVRAKIGVRFGEKVGRSGGRALDFYASQALWLSHLKTFGQTIGGQKRATAIRIRAKCKKNKLAMPFRDCEFNIRFGFGVDDVAASLDFLAETKMLSMLEIKPAQFDDYYDETMALPPEEYLQRAALIRTATLHAWNDVEKRFEPARRKYEVAA